MAEERQSCGRRRFAPTATVTADANGNITRVQEAWTGAPNNWRTDFTFDYENRLTQVQGMTVVGGTVVTWNTVNHSYDGIGRRLKTTAGGVNYGHIYDGLKLAGNRNLGTSTDGTAWVNAVNDARPLAALRISTAGATRYYSVSDERDPVRRTYTDGGTAGDTSQQSHYGQYELINGNAPVFSFYGPRGTKQSEVFPVRSLTFTENDVALPAERGNLEYAGLALVYEGNRVKSALLGRDLNPLGRGDGAFYFSGAVKFSAVGAGSLRSWNVMVGTGNSVNNPSQTGGGYTPIGPPSDGSSSSMQLELTSDWEKRTGKKPVGSSIWDSPPGGGLPTLIIGCTCCPGLSACCMTMNAAGDYMPYTRCFEGPTAPCDDPSACGAPPTTPGAKGGGGGSTGGGGGCSGCGGGGGGGPMSYQGGNGGGPMSWQGAPQGAPSPPPPPQDGGGPAKPPQPGGGGNGDGWPWDWPFSPPEDVGGALWALSVKCRQKVDSWWPRVQDLLAQMRARTDLPECACLGKDFFDCLQYEINKHCYFCAWLPPFLAGVGYFGCAWLNINMVLQDDGAETVPTIIWEYSHTCGLFDRPYGGGGRSTQMLQDCFEAIWMHPKTSGKRTQ